MGANSADRKKSSVFRMRQDGLECWRHEYVILTRPQGNVLYLKFVLSSKSGPAQHTLLGKDIRCRFVESLLHLAHLAHFAHM